MNAIEKAFRDMVDRRSWEHIKKNHSQGTIYRSLERYEPHMEKLYNELSGKVTKLEHEETEVSEQVKEAKEEHDILVAENQELLREQDKISTEIDALGIKKNEAQQGLEDFTSKLTHVQEKIVELGKRNLTPENLSKILESDIESPEELSERVKTKIEHSKLLEQNQRLEESLVEKREQEQEAVSRLEQIQLDILSEENKLDEFKHRNQFLNHFGL